MSSILTNTSAMVALQTMKSINMNLNQTTSEISTGKRVGSAKDNSAIWAISKVMESDVQSFKGISDSLALGSSTIAVARQAAETVTTHLTSIKAKIVAAQESNVDKAKIQSDIDNLVSQIGSVVSAAQFNGLNFVNNNNTVTILSSLDRASNGTVSASHISVAGVDLSTAGYVAKDVFASTAGEVSAEGDVASFLLATDGTPMDITFANDVLEAGDKVSISIGGRTATYTVTEDDALSDSDGGDLVAVGLKRAVEALEIEDLTVTYDSGNPGQLIFENGGTKGLSASFTFSNKGSGGLGALDNIDVVADASAALAGIDTLLDTAIDASAAFGSAQTRVDTQKEFIGKLSDSMKAGIGSLVDADMEEASARLQALQVQQQLSTQALSIANQQPQALLSLFR